MFRKGIITKVYKLYGSASADTSALASLVLSRRGVITAIAFCLEATTVAAQGDIRFTLSMQSTNQPTVSDINTELAMAGIGPGYTTSGGYTSVQNHALAGLAIAVEQGQRLYLHAEAYASCTANCSCFVYINE